jgi:hypothetical protein
MISFSSKYALPIRKHLGHFSCICNLEFISAVAILIFAVPFPAEAIELQSPSIEVWGDHLSSNEKWLVRAIRWQTGRIYRLADDNAVSPSGLLVRSVEAVGIFFEYKPIKKFSIALGGSYVFRHRYEIQNENGDQIQSYVNINAALGATLNFRFRF